MIKNSIYAHKKFKISSEKKNDLVSWSSIEKMQRVFKLNQKA